MDGSLFQKLNKDKKSRQRAVTVLCLVLVCVALLVFWRMGKIGVAMTDRTICGITEHTHDEHCVAERVLMCEDADHVHTDDCYATVWSCGLEAHSHTSACYPDRTADVESPETWEASLPELSGYPVSDIVRIAESQRGYTESTRNVEFEEHDDGSYETYGYTRYGAFAEQPYCDNWSAAFVSFCLHYSGMTESDAPCQTECETMMQSWADEDKVFEPALHDALPGDLVFLDHDADGAVDSVGIVTFANADCIRAIEGNSNEAVEENEILLTDGTILGYGVYFVEETIEDSDDATASAPADSEVPQLPSASTSGSSWIGSIKRKALKATKGLKASSAPPLRSGAAADMPLDNYISGVTATGTTKVDDHHYLTMLEMAFNVDPETALDVMSSDHKFYFDLPEEISVLDELVEGGPYSAYKIDSIPLELAFTYSFVPNGDGTYRIEVNFDENYVQDAIISGSDYIFNALRFRCYINVDEGDAGDGLDISFTTDQTLHIPPDEINEDYDISTQKTGSFTSDGKLRYEVTVSSVNGTPSTVDLTDTFTYSGEGTVSAPSTISVVHHYADGSVDTFDVPAQGHVTSTSQNTYDIDLNLPQLNDGEYYTLTYEYAVSGLTSEDAAVSAYNSIEATSSDEHESTSDISDYFIYNQQRNRIGKGGIPYGDYVQWVISVNDRGGDVAGKVVYDDSFADARNETINGTNGIVVQKGWGTATPGVDYEFVYDNGGEIIGVRFLPADGSTPNNNTYHITYYTYPDVAYGETAVEHNEAEFDGDTASYDVVVTGGDIEKTENGGESVGNGVHVMNWTVTVKVPVGGIPSGTEFSDTLSPVGHTMTQAQYNALVTALQTAWGSTPVTVSPVYTAGNITGYTFTVGTEGNGNLLDDGFVDEITWQYQTTGDMGDKTKETFVNTISDGEKTLPVNNTISPNVKKLNVRKVSDWQTIFTEDPTTIAFDYEDEDKTFVWIVEVTPTSGVTQYRVTDVLPEGVELLGIKVQPSPLSPYTYGSDSGVGNNMTIAADGTISGEIGNLWFYRTTASGSVTTTADGRQAVDLILTGNNANASLFQSAFNVIYYCQLSEDAWPTNGTAHITLDNTVDVTADGAEYGEAENEIIIDATNTPDVVGKSGRWDKETHLITYTVDINPTAENLLTSSGGTVDPEWLSFTDILTYTAKQGTGTGEAVLNLNSVILEKEEDGVWSPLQNIQWTAHTETDPTDPNVKQAFIEMKIPDSTHLRLTYSYYVNSSMSDGITLQNSATVEGHGDESGDNNTHIDVEDFQTSGESNFKEYRLIKIDQEDGRPLSGAVFTVYTWDSQNHRWVATEKTYTTDNDGKIIIKATDKFSNGTNVYSKDTAYCIMETTAPAGYILPENPRPFYFWFSEHEDAPLNGPDDFMLTAADVSTSSHRIEAENQCAPDYVLDTGIYGIKLLSSAVALVAAGFGTYLIAMKIIRKKKSYCSEI